MDTFVHNLYNDQFKVIGMSVTFADHYVNMYNAIINHSCSAGL